MYIIFCSVDNANNICHKQSIKLYIALSEMLPIVPLHSVLQKVAPHPVAPVYI